MTKRIAMWSGPRDLSTAMMYSFAARNDCRVADEPFYAAYLAETGLEHPMREQIMRSQRKTAAEVVESLFSPISEPVFYQKHMTHHMLPEWPTDWIQEVTNVFLIRHPARVIASYAKKREDPTLDDIGFVQQACIFDMVEAPIVIDLVLLEWARRLILSPKLPQGETDRWQEIIAGAEAWEKLDFPLRGRDALDPQRTGPGCRGYGCAGSSGQCRRGSTTVGCV